MQAWQRRHRVRLRLAPPPAPPPSALLPDIPEQVSWTQRDRHTHVSHCPSHLDSTACVQLSQTGEFTPVLNTPKTQLLMSWTVGSVVFVGHRRGGVAPPFFKTGESRVQVTVLLLLRWDVGWVEQSSSAELSHSMLGRPHSATYHHTLASMPHQPGSPWSFGPTFRTCEWWQLLLLLNSNHKPSVYSLQTMETSPIRVRFCCFLKDRFSLLHITRLRVRTHCGSGLVLTKQAGSIWNWMEGSKSGWHNKPPPQTT